VARILGLQGAVLALIASPCANVASADSPLPTLRADGAAAAHDLVVEVNCAPNHYDRARCTVVASGRVEALDEEVRFCVEPCGGALETPEGVSSVYEAVTWIGEPSMDPPHSLARGEAALMSHPPLGLRHPLLGESWLQYRSAIELVVNRSTAKR